MPSINLTSKQELVLRPALDIDKYKKLVLNKKTGRTDHKLVRSILMEIAVAFGVASDFGKYDKGRNIRRRLVEVADSMTDTSVASVSQGVKLTSGSVDLGMVVETSDFATKEDLGLLGARIDKLAEAMNLIAAAIAPKS